MTEKNGRLFSASTASGRLYEDVAKANFNPAERRDVRGWWSKDESSETNSSVSPVVYRGYYHDVVVDDFLNGLKAVGSTVLKNVPVLGVNGVIAIPDGASNPKASATPYFLEMKTGNDPKFKPNQLLVYRLICLGGHATSVDPRITQLGLIPGVPFPPMRIMLVVTSGPGQPFGFIDYCRSIGVKVP